MLSISNNIKKSRDDCIQDEELSIDIICFHFYPVTWTAHAIVAVVLDEVVDVLEEAAEDSCWGWYTPPATPPSNISFKGS